MSLPKALQERPLRWWSRLRLGSLHNAADIKQAEHLRFSGAQLWL
jgi:hypothetical protein